MKIAFYTPQLDVRGSCVAIYDYAYYNEELLGNMSVIVIPKTSNNEEEAMLKFGRRFQIRKYDINIDEELFDCDVLYCIKYGTNDGILSLKIKTVIHCVFDLSEPHGDVYAAVSDTLCRKFNKSLFVPHMIGLKPSKTKENLRDHFNIPKGSVVFGRHGGMDTFDLSFVMQTISNTVQTNPNIYFLFVNTPRFFTHKRIIHINKIIDLDEKNRFICTCDAMIHAQSLGETFGLSIAEFSVNNKPIITYGGAVWNDTYKEILGDRAIYYDTPENLYESFVTFDPQEWEKKDNNCYKDYSPNKVMRKFEQVFLI